MKNDHSNGQPIANSRAAIADGAIPNEPLTRFGNLTPSESLGLPKGNNLARPFIQAVLITVVVFAALTVGPYAINSSTPEEAQGDVPAAKGDQPVAPKPPPVSPGPEATAKGNGSSTAPPAAISPGNKAAVLDKLGVNTKKTAPASVNPLDKKDDDILKDIK